MKVLHLGKFYPIAGGVEKVMFDLCTGLSARGITSNMLCASTNNKSEYIKINSHFNIFCTASLCKAFATMLSPQMISKLRSICNEYDIIHVHHPDPMACLALFLSGYKGKVVLHWHSDILKQGFLLNFYKPLQSWLINRADLIFGTTPKYIAYSEALKKVQDKCIALPIGIEKPIRYSDRANEIKKLYNGKKLIFSLGRLVEYKGFEYLIGALRLLPKDYCCVIGGNGPLKEELQRKIDTNNLQERVKLVGRLSDEDVNAYFEACDIFALSSIMKTEAFAIVQIEAMAFSKPIISCDIEGSGVSWVNKDGVSGVVVPTRNEKALADGICKVLSDKQYYDSLCVSSHERFEELFKIEKMIDGCLEGYRKLAIEPHG